MAAIVNAGIKGYNRLHFEWFLVNWCNFKCSYCNAADRMVEKYSKESSPSKHKLVLGRLSLIDTDFEIDLFGGEPTLHPEFLDIIKALAKMPRCKLIEIKTNLSRPLAYLEKTLVNDKVRLAASYHAQYYNDEFLKKCVALKDYNFYCHINLSDKPEDWPQIVKMIDKFDQYGVKYDLNILLSTPEYEVQYSPEFYNTFEHRLNAIADKATYRLQYDDGVEQHLPVFKIIEHKLGNFNGFKCQARLYEIDAQGNIINSCTREPLLFLIKEKDLPSMVTCPKHICHADMMLNFYKEKPNDKDSQS